MKILQIALSDLHPDPVNVRRVGRVADPVFMASIAARGGVIEPLLVRKNGKGWLVSEGEKRRLACVALVKAGKFKADITLPCIDTGDATDTEARDTSLTANVIRTAMHPVDEYRAFAELHFDPEHPLSVDDIATRYGLAKKHVEQRLALGALNPKVLDAWTNGEINAETAQAFTLCPDQAAQLRIFRKLSKEGSRVNAWNVKAELKLGNNNIGRMLDVVGAEAYEARGGKVTRDLFGTDHNVSDTALLALMLGEKVTTTCEALIADGWAWAIPASEAGEAFKYGRVDVKINATPQERKRLGNLQTAIEDGTLQDDDLEAASMAYDKLLTDIQARSYSKAKMKASGCIVGVSSDGCLTVDFGRTKPKEVKASPAPVEQTSTKKPVKKANGQVSNALTQRLSEQLTAAAAVAIAKEPIIAMVALLAGFASHDKTVSVSERGLVSKKKGPTLRNPTFDSMFATLRRKGAGELQTGLAQVASAALDFQTLRGDRPALSHKGVAALCNAMQPKALNKAIRATFDAKDYFAAISRPMIVRATAEAMGDDHAAKIAKMNKAAAAKFATANLPKTGWLPEQLRIAHYDGPRRKPAKASATPKKKAGKRVSK